MEMYVVCSGSESSLQFWIRVPEVIFENYPFGKSIVLLTNLSRVMSYAVSCQ